MPQRISLIGPDRLRQQGGLAEASASDDDRDGDREAAAHLLEQARPNELVRAGRAAELVLGARRAAGPRPASGRDATPGVGSMPRYCERPGPMQHSR